MLLLLLLLQSSTAAHPPDRRPRRQMRRRGTACLSASASAFPRALRLPCREKNTQSLSPVLFSFLICYSLSFSLGFVVILDAARMVCGLGSV